MSKGRVAAHSFIGALLGFATMYEFTHDGSWVWVAILGSLAIANILGAFTATGTRKDDA